MSSATVRIPSPADCAAPTTTSRAELSVRTLRPDRRWEWDHYVKQHPEGTLFHTLAWRDSVRASFGHEDHYLTALRDQRIVGVLPLTRIASRLTGRRLVSVPYGVGGGILADDPETALALFDEARNLVSTLGCTLLELRSDRAQVPDLPVSERYCGFRRTLPQRAEDVLAWLPRKARAAARNARKKYGLTVSFDDGHLPEVWRLYSLSMKRLASINYPYSFFENLVRATPDRHWVSLVSWQGKPVAGLVTFMFGETVLPYFVGTADAARQCSAANYVYLTLMERAVKHGYRVFDFGRTRSDNHGSFDFKRFHGFEPRPLGYQYYTPPGAHPVELSPSNPKLAWARELWKYLPLRLTRPLGARLARHIPG